MRAIDPELAAHLAGGATTLATCWRIARKDGAVHGFTDHDRPLAFGGALFEPDAGADGAALVSTSDLGVDNSEIAGALSSDRLAPELLASGRFDGATVEIWRVNWAAPAQRLLLKRGAIGEVRREGGRFFAEIRGLGAALERTEGRVYQRGCDAVLGDARCGVDLLAPARRAVSEVALVLDEARFSASDLEGYAAQWFADGRIDWLSGANAGTSGHVRSHGADELALWTPPGAAIAPGDAFAVFAGCDKSFATCRSKFANALNFRGFPHMPGADAAISYPLRSERNDGGKR